MDKVSLLQNRLGAIAEAVKNQPNGLGLLGLGSAGKEMARMDEFSDLDFFAIVRPGYKQAFIDDLAWLGDIAEIAWYFRNTPDGYKLLFDDGVFCEFAVFEPHQLAGIAYAEGQYIWRDDSLSLETEKPQMDIPEQSQNEAFLLGELLTNLYVGLGRFRRGEKCSAMRFIQVYAVDRLITLLDLHQSQNVPVDNDGFCPDRRVEHRHQAFQSLLSRCMLGAEKSPESAMTLLAFVKHHYSINPRLEQQIRQWL